MMNSTMLGIVVVSAMVVLSAFITGIVLAAQKKWGGALACLIILVFGLIISIGTGTWWIVKLVEAEKAAMMAAAKSEADEQARAEARAKEMRAQIKALTPAVDWSVVSEDFLEYNDAEDFDRLPVRYPYEIQQTKQAALCRNVSNGQARNKSDFKAVEGVKDLADFAADARMMVYHSDDYSGKETWGIFVFDKEENKTFGSERAMWAEARKRGWTGAEELESLDDRYADYWAGM